MEKAENKQAQLLNVVPTVHVGITGHRVLPAEVLGRITRQVREVLDAVQGTARELMAEQGGALPPACVSGELRFRLLTPLAEGADRLAAREALSLGYSIQCPLPFSQAFYESTFAEDEARHTEFRELLGKAESVLELAGSNEGFTSQAYADVSSIVVNHADFLLAIWDGKPNRYIAGTYSTVNQALRRHIPVIVIDATAGDAPIAYREDSLMRGDWKEALRGHLQQFLFPRGADGTEGRLFPLPQPQKHRLRVWLRGVEKLLLGKDNAAPPLPQQAAELVAPPPASALWMERKQCFSAVVAEMSASYRNLLTGRLLFPLLATVFLTLALAAAALPLLRMVFFALQVLCLLLSLLQVVWDRFARYHRRFLCYRVMAELCRQTAFLYPMGFADVRFRHRSYRRPDGSDITAWYYRMLLRHQGLPQGKLTHAELKNWLRWVREKLLVPQQRYHDNRARRCNILQTKLGLLAVCLFSLGLCATVIRAWLGSMGGAEYKEWLTLFASLALMFPPAAVFFSSLSQNAGYPTHSTVSRNMGDFFRAVVADTDALLQKPEGEIYYTDILRLCEEIDLRCREELSDWEDSLRAKPLKWV